MKKARATKILCAVVAMMMVLATGVSAMAAELSINSLVKYNADSTYTVTTTVTGGETLDEGEMVTYLVHNAANMYNVTPANIAYIDQAVIEDGVAEFTYTKADDGENAALIDGYTIYVGAESLTGPQTSVAEEDNNATVKVNGNVVSGLEIGNKEATGDSIKTIAIENVAKVTSVKVNGTEVEFFICGTELGFVSPNAITAADVIEILTGNDANLAGEFALKVGYFSLTENSLLVIGRVDGTTECGIMVDEEDYPALGVSTEGGFAVELVDETEGADLAAEFAESTVDVYAMMGTDILFANVK